MNFPLSDVAKERRDTYTKAEVDALIKYAIDEQERLMKIYGKTYRDASVISMILGFIALTVFGWNSPIVGNYSTFMGIDIDILDKIVDRVEEML